MSLSLSTIIHNICSRLLIALLLVVLAIPLLLIILMPKRWKCTNRFKYYMMHAFYVVSLKCALIPVTVRGKENIPDTPVIIAANHQSSLDIPLVGCLVDCHPHVWLARSELMQSWLLRFVLPYFAVIVDVYAPMRAMRSLLKIMNVAKGQGSHLIIFPEGERHYGEQVQEFFGGFVTLAKTMKRPVVPVRIFNANKVYPRDAWWAYWYPITVVVGKPLIMGNDETDESFKRRVHQWFIEQKEI